MRARGLDGELESTLGFNNTGMKAVFMLIVFFFIFSC